MERALLWFKCAAMHDPVRPVIKRPAALGWEAKNRQIDLIIERPFKGDELLYRMKGWFTADVHKTVEIIKQHGKLKILDEYNLVVETNTIKDLETLSDCLKDMFGDEVWIEHIPKTAIR
jgi:hypothetical protein